MPPWLCWRPSKHCSWVNNVFSNQLILLQAVAQANAWRNQSQTMEPGFCRLLALTQRLNYSWLCVCINSAHPTADVLETPLGKTILGQKSGCFTQLSHETAEILVGWSLSRSLLHSWDTLMQSLLSETPSGLWVLHLGCCCRSKISWGPGEQQNSVF